jgi:hypothetical protein
MGTDLFARKEIADRDGRIQTGSGLFVPFGLARFVEICFAIIRTRLMVPRGVRYLKMP